MAGRPAVRLRYSAYLAEGSRVEGLWIATPLPDGRLLTATLTVHPGTYFKSARAVYEQVLQSLVLTNPMP